MALLYKISVVGQQIHLVRHGEVYNPNGILYGLQPGWTLSKRGRDMAAEVAQWSSDKNIGAIVASPLTRAQETASPIAAKHKIDIITDSNLIEAANIFEGKKFELGSGILRHPSSWYHLRNPFKPSWGEPYEVVINRMLEAIFNARDLANGKDAICVSHQLPIWITRRFIENKNLIHNPRKRECSLASVTTLHLNDDGEIAGVVYQEPAKHLLRAKHETFEK
jgi:broad specificity phosphatase PhoE